MYCGSQYMCASKYPFDEFERMFTSLINACFLYLTSRHKPTHAHTSCRVAMKIIAVHMIM